MYDENFFMQIALGTVTNVEEAVKWLSYTYLFVRLQCNPLVYGVPYKSVEVSVFRNELNMCQKVIEMLIRAGLFKA